ncbi:MAG: WD40/YVTN/BNR-like repeat-containing protein [Gaiellales bacterium]
MTIVTIVATGCGASERPVALPAHARALAVAPDFAGTIWDVTGARAYRSMDGGHSWDPVPGPAEGWAVAFTDHATVVIGPAGTALSDFEGGLLVPWRPTPAGFVALASPYHRTDRLYALDASGRLWLSVTAGKSWVRLLAQGLPPGAVGLSAVRDDVTMPDIIYVAAGGRGLWRSVDFGATFRRVPGIARATAVATTTDEQDLVLVAGDGIYLSTDRGRSFTRTSRQTVTAVAYDPRNHDLAFAATGDGRLLRSIDAGRTW